MINENSMLYCLIAFIIGYLVYRMTRGNGFSIGGSINDKLDELKTMVTGVEAGVDEICQATDGCIPSCKGTNTYKGKTIDNCKDAAKDGNIGGDKCSWINGSGNAADGSWVDIGDRWGDGSKILIGTQCIIDDTRTTCSGLKGGVDDKYNLCKITPPA
jgi:hypothetical protein